MPNRKRNLSTNISHDLEKKIKIDVADTNCLILPKKKKGNQNSTNKNRPENKDVLLTKKQRKNLQKITKATEDKSIIKDLYEELKIFSELRPTEAIESLKNDVKKTASTARTTLSTKVKPVSKRKYKRWENRTDISIVHNEEADPDTSDFSSDEEILEVVDKIIIADETEKLKKLSNCDDNDKSIKPVLKEEIITIASPPVPVKIIPKTFVTVNRPKEIEESRLQLPILGEESTIMEAINDNDIIIVSGATGCGKTTQVPQFLYEAGYTKNGYKVGITEPRRIAAISVSERVKYELSCQNSDLVAYHVRYQNTSTCSTQIKFMTDGILLQELKNDILLQSYSAIIIDEAHERSVFTDVLIGLLSIVVRARRRAYDNACTSTTTLPPPQTLPLKLIIMSATLRVADFAENRRLFPGEKRPPVIELDSRQFPVQVTFSKHTRSNYLEEAFKMIYKVHNENIEGGILVFVTGQQDCLSLCKWLQKAFPVTQKFLSNVDKQSCAKPMSTNRTNKASHKTGEVSEPELMKVNLTDFSIIPIDEEAELNTDMNEDNEDEEVSDDDVDMAINFNDVVSGMYVNNSCVNPVYALPLYSLLDKDKQDLVFQTPPPGQRLVVIATNVAETSLTIPNIKYVIDTGMEKVKKWDKVTGMSKFQLERISKSSAEQRKGRAGRTGPGQCFRLYSSAIFEEMKPFSLPEIVQRPVEDVVLLLRNYIHSSIAIHDFCLPTVPSQMAIDKAERMLIAIGALRRTKLGSKNMSEITELGKSMTQIPLSPRFARMLLLSNQHNLLPYAVLIASLLSVADFFSNNATSLSSEDSSEANLTSVNFKRESIKKKADLLLGDITVLLGSFCKLENVFLRSEDEAKRTADVCGVRWKAFVEVRKLRQQITDILNCNVKGLNLSVSVLSRPTNDQFEHLRQLVLSGSPENVAVLSPVNVASGQRRRDRGTYSSCNMAKPVYIHAHSVLSREKYKWVVYQDVYENVVHQGQDQARPFMRNLSVIEPEWLTLFCTLNCRVEGLFLDNRQESGARPVYDAGHDKIMACAKRICYGPMELELPAGTRIPMVFEIMENEESQADLLCRWFARFLLEGGIVADFGPWRAKMKSSCKPELLQSPFANSRTEIIGLMADIRQLGLPSRRALYDKWKLNSNYLLDSYLEWIRVDERESVIAEWPPALLE